MSVKHVITDKVQSSLEPVEREQEFQRRLGSGWREDYTRYRSLWNDLPARREVRDYPLLLDLEMSSACNLHCPMCPTATPEHQANIEKRFLDFELFKKAVDEAAGKIFSLRLSLVGEPTLHPRLCEAVAYARGKGIPEISFLTNGSRLSLDYFRELAEAGLDWITVSVDGVDAHYEAIRRPLKFAETLRKLQDIKDYKDRTGRLKPVVKVQGVWPAIKPDPEGYYNTIAPWVDLVMYNALCDYLQKDDDAALVYEEDFHCPQMYQRLVISSNGMAKMCSYDEERSVLLGDLSRQTLHHIWHGERMKEIRALQGRNNGFLELHACRRCPVPRRMETIEHVTINGRLIAIEGYVNRKQVVGE